MDGGNLGIITLIPMLSFFVFAFITRRCVFSILLSGILGFLFYYGADFFEPTVQALLDAACDADNNYIVIICLLFGCFVQLLRQSNGATAMANWARKYVKSERQVLFLTWLCGVIIFIDDYLSILVTANTILPIADEKKTPREMLCYIINTTSAPVCLIIPISAWVVFFSGIFAEQPGSRRVGRLGYGHLLFHHAVLLLPVFVRAVRAARDFWHCAENGWHQEGVRARRENRQAVARFFRRDEPGRNGRGVWRHQRRFHER